jgi:hypothetical protein
VLRGGAAPADVEALERRLGVALPPSYRAFLELSNGAWAQVGWGVMRVGEQTGERAEERALGFLDAGRVEWFRDREPQYVDIWAYTDYGATEDDDPAHYAFRRLVPECEYLDHEREQDCVHAKPGHVRYALQISNDVDGYTILLNPLVVDQDGEWEAWDFGSKLPGAIRYRSFAELIAADVERLEREVASPPSGLEEARATFADESRPLRERASAAALVAWHGEQDQVRDFLVDVLADRSVDVDPRQAAAGALGRIDDPRATASLVAAAEDAELRLQAALLPPLAASEDADARRAALSILTSPDVEDWVIRSTWPSSRETLWLAWRVTGDLRVLAQLAYCGDTRACGPLAEAIVDSAVPAEHRRQLIQYAWWARDPGVVPALIAATGLPDTPLVAVAQALLRLGAEDDAVAVLARAVREDDPFGQAAQELGLTRRAEARDALLDVVRDAPTVPVALALGSFGDAEVAQALLGVATQPGLETGVVDALEKMGTAPARDALAVLAERSILAARALGRQRDRRALELLLAALEHEDPGVAFEGADGLRDLRAAESVAALLAEAQRGRDDDVAACAAHALVSMRASESELALDVLERSPSASLRRLAELWR